MPGNPFAEERWAQAARDRAAAVEAEKEAQRQAAREKAQGVLTKIGSKGMKTDSIIPVWNTRIEERDGRGAGRSTRVEDPALGLSGFRMPVDNDHYATFDAEGNYTGTHQIERGGGFFGGLSDALTDLSHSIADSPALMAAITTIAAANGVPPGVVAATLGANRAGKDGNIQAGLETGILSYGLGELSAPDAAGGGASGDAPVIEGGPGADVPPGAPPGSSPNIDIKDVTKTINQTRDIVQNPIGAATKAILDTLPPGSQDYINLLNAIAGTNVVANTVGKGVKGVLGPNVGGSKPTPQPKPKPQPKPGDTKTGDTTVNATSPDTPADGDTGGDAYGIPLGLLALLGAQQPQQRPQIDPTYRPDTAALKFDPFR